jgi:hypothetical protein
MTTALVFMRQWQQASLSESWTGASQWWSPAVDAVAEALADRDTHRDTHGNTHRGSHREDDRDCDARAASAALGRDRADAGVFLDEARADLETATRVARVMPGETAQLLDALTVGWVDRTLDTYYVAGCVDPLTELASMPYLLARLSELYAEAGFRDTCVADSHALVAVDIADVADPLESEVQLIALQSAMRAAFRGGETLARVGRSTAVALVARSEPRLSKSLLVLRIELQLGRAEQRLGNPRMWLERLPSERSAVPAALRTITQ